MKLSLKKVEHSMWKHILHLKIIKMPLTKAADFLFKIPQETKYTK
jgi:hypothetical protein